MPEHTLSSCRGRRLVSGRRSTQAIKNAVEDAAKTLRNIHWFQVVETRGHIEDGKVKHFQVTVKIGFTLDDR